MRFAIHGGLIRGQSFDWSNNSGAIDVKMDDSVFEENLSFKIIQLPFSSELELGSYIVFIAKTASQKN